jgi:anti-sigma factor RsiW
VNAGPSTRVDPSACDAARLRVSLSLDGELDDVGRLRLDHHLAVCTECAGIAARMEAASVRIRRAPLGRFRCELRGARLVRPRTSARRHHRHLAGAVVAVVALVLATGALPGRSEHPSPHVRRTSATGTRVSPLELPIGQRQAMDDFSAPALARRLGPATHPD